MENIVENGLLYDFYGELLTEHQRRVYEDAVYNDMTLVEIADEYNISKQGVHDLLRRCTNLLEGYENKLHMVERTERIRKQLDILNSAAANENMEMDQLRSSVLMAARDIAEELS